MNSIMPQWNAVVIDVTLRAFKAQYDKRKFEGVQTTLYILCKVVDAWSLPENK